MSTFTPYVSKAYGELKPMWESKLNYRLPNGEMRVANLELYDYSEKSMLFSAEPEFFNSFYQYLEGIGMIGYKYKVPKKAGVCISKKQYQTPRIQGVINDILSGKTQAHASSYSNSQESSAFAPSTDSGQMRAESDALSMLDQLRGVSISSSVSQVSMVNSSAESFKASLAPVPGIPRAALTVQESLNSLKKAVLKDGIQEGSFYLDDVAFIVASYDKCICYSSNYDFVIENPAGLSLMRVKKSFNIYRDISNLRENLKTELPAGQIFIDGKYWIWDRVDVNSTRHHDNSTLIQFSDSVCSVLITNTIFNLPQLEIEKRGRALFDLYRGVYQQYNAPIDIEGVMIGTKEQIDKFMGDHMGPLNLENIAVPDITNIEKIVFSNGITIVTYEKKIANTQSEIALLP